MAETLESFLGSDHFFGCALAAYVEIANRCGKWPPSEEVRKLAYAYYEAEMPHVAAGSCKKTLFDRDQ